MLVVPGTVPAREIKELDDRPPVQLAQVMLFIVVITCLSSKPKSRILLKTTFVKLI